MFLIKCTFWLGLVFVALPDHPEFPRAQTLPSAQARPVAQSLAGKGAEAISGKVADFCAKQPARCLELAARAQALAGGASSLRPDDLLPAWSGSVAAR